MVVMLLLLHVSQHPVSFGGPSEYMHWHVVVMLLLLHVSQHPASVGGPIVK